MIPLAKEHYDKIREPLRAIPFNTLFARQVINGHIDEHGIHAHTEKVFVDDVSDPRSIYILHPYGMSLIFGDLDNTEFNDWLKTYIMDTEGERTKNEYLQVYPKAWGEFVKEIAGSSYHALGDGEDHDGKKIVEDERINMTFRKLKNIPQDPSCQVVGTTGDMFYEMAGTVIPKFFWRDADDFVDNSVGFSALVDGKLASTAFAAFIVEDRGIDKRYLEIGIETLPEYHGRGLARQACAALIEYCLENGYEPAWSCRGNNIGSYKLAESLGFEEELRLGYWMIKASE